MTEFRGERASTAFAYLHPSMGRRNLTVLTEAQVLRILFSEDGRRAVGVEYLKKGEKVQVFVTKEVIVSAGAINSPKLLQLSGIGPAEELGRLGIPTLRVGALYHSWRIVLSMCGIANI
jgi:choline dehydrogenase